MSIRRAIVPLAALLFCGAGGAQTDAKFPSQITATDGKVYKDTVLLDVYPDGILVSYKPVPHGVGMAKVKFTRLPEELQKQYGYDPKAAADYEKVEAQGAAQLREQFIAGDALTRYRQLAELHQILGGFEAASYTVSMDANGKVTAQGITGTPPSLVVTNVGAPGYMGPPYGMGAPYGMEPPYNGMAPDYGQQQLPASPAASR